MWPLVAVGGPDAVHLAQRVHICLTSYYTESYLPEVCRKTAERSTYPCHSPTGPQRESCRRCWSECDQIMGFVAKTNASCAQRH